MHNHLLLAPRSQGRVCHYRKDDSYCTPIRTDPSLTSETLGEIVNGEIAMGHQVEEAGGVKWLFIETDDGYVGYVKMDYCCPLKRRRE